MNASMIGADLMIRGDLITSGEIQVDGEVIGDIGARVVTVGVHAEIHGEIVAETIIIEGKVTGRLRGRSIKLTRTAQTVGEIWHRTLGVEAGAFVQGLCRHTDEPDGAIADGDDSRAGLVLTAANSEATAQRSLTNLSPAFDIPIAAAGR